jgi:hypothetical protein
MAGLLTGWGEICREGQIQMTKTKGHSERCRECKKRVGELLSKLFGEVSMNYQLEISSGPASLGENLYSLALNRIFSKLQQFRGFTHFVKAKKLPKVDFFVHNPGFVFEFDESQHFTEPRRIALSQYPDHIALGFSKDKWISLCEKLQKKDNDPPYRDEQRAWYDTMRDFAAPLLGLKPTVRVFSKDLVWCELNPESDEDINRFKEVISEGI